MREERGDAPSVPGESKRMHARKKGRPFDSKMGIRAVGDGVAREKKKKGEDER